MESREDTELQEQTRTRAKVWWKKYREGKKPENKTDQTKTSNPKPPNQQTNKKEKREPHSFQSLEHGLRLAAHQTGRAPGSPT